ncbi:3-methyl-2-oxobutanoate hydroxymethyltransferase [Granulicella arctica]|uniref:3-methyl-2-oxobutanoate hydroxymethyltransferase n=1 Tax=Granulicella arctica TaxID=940613 RepID=A0A7Y9TGF3_9BACT|nr:3-methyl-2-oxobutanoate hydroxymethyltransferase [Granulicella arctica]NYF78700.1 3-methyl-2-oxobutanoate hydroxymethyltransferase [Granulicella arctica]
MSLTTFTPRQAERESPPVSTKAPTKVTTTSLQEKKRLGQPITAVTAYDYASARIIDEAGLDLILVGDSLAMVMQGQPNTLAITMDEMLLYTRGVRRAVRHALLVADMPFGSYHATPADGVANAIRFIKEAGAEAVKIEGPRIELVKQLTQAEIPVVGHLGLTPQSVHRMGGFKVQGKTIAAIDALREDALSLEAAGCCAIVLEGIPREAARLITDALDIPTIGIGAGPDCDGQILVLHDMLSLTFSPAAKFVRRYADLGAVMRDALTEYKRDVTARTFPSEAESYHLPHEARLLLATLHVGNEESTPLTKEHAPSI